MRTKTLKQVVVIHSTCYKVYEAFMNDDEHQDFTGFEATIDKNIGGYFNTCGGRNWGYNLYLEPGKRIIQAWRQQSFADEHYTVIDIKLSETKDSFCKLKFTQFSIPEEDIDWLKQGWKETYWLPLKQYLELGFKQELRD